MYHQWPSTSINKWPPGKRKWLECSSGLEKSSDFHKHHQTSQGCHKGVTREAESLSRPFGFDFGVRVCSCVWWIWMDLDGFGVLQAAPSYPRIINPFQKCEASPTHPLTSTYRNLACVFPKPGGVRKRTRPGGMSGQRHRSMSPVFSGSLAFSSVAQLFRWSHLAQQDSTRLSIQAAASGQMSTISSIVWGPKTSFSSSTWAVCIWSWIIMVFKKDFWSFRQI